MKALYSTRVFALAVILFAWCLACKGSPPPLRVVRHDTSITLDVQTLGEYQTTVSRIRLTDRSASRVVWEIVVSAGTPQIHSVTLVVGKNPATISDPGPGDYSVVTPSGTGVFRLEAGKPYLVEVWRDSGNSVPATAFFQF